MDTNTNALNWFEIPANDIKRAKKFYETVFGITMDESDMMGMQMAMFPYESNSGKASGAVVQSQMHKPSQDGSVVYLNADPNMQTILDKIPSAGGQVVMPRTHISEDIGYMAFFLDTEGNKVALHSQN
ncbi:MAG TPA: VOC family protein [Flavipsychrobacter sp.]|nr:VOC family protein [Flavipsychrobacter sp.]